MGHQRLGKLPAYRLLPEIIRYLIDGGAPTADLVDEVTQVGQDALKLALRDPVFIEALWLLVRLPQAASSRVFPDALIHEPCVCFYGTTTPSTFWKALEHGAMLDGSLARFLVFVTDNDRPERNRTAGIIDPPAELIAALKAIIRGQGEPPPLGNLPEAHTAHMLATEAAAPYTVPMTPAADALHERHLTEEDAWAKRVAGTPQAAIVNRLGENAAKLAVISAISRNPAHPEITEAEVAWGWALASSMTLDAIRRGGSAYETVRG